MVKMHIHPGSVPAWNDLNIIHRNALPPRASFSLYDTEADALSRHVTKAKVKCLSGKWKFHSSPSPFTGPSQFYHRDFDAAEFHNVQVPGMWQRQGFGKGPQYTNILFPFPVDPPNVPYEDNECGRYLTAFNVDESFAGCQLRLRFEGVDAAFTVWVNGQEVGYSQGSRNPSEFDVTDLVHVKSSNTLAVEVYQRCDGSYLEDQDQWWLSGIFRDVYLHAFPRVHPVDFHVITELDEKYEDATLKVKVELNAASSVELKLFSAEGEEIVKDTVSVNKTSTFELPVKKPYKWTAETPYLYTLVLNILDGSKCSLAQRVGFRSAGLIDGVFCVNGQPVKFRGVNRHEHHPDHGRAVPYEFMRNDLLLMKQHNVNAIRTSHYPNDPRMYDVADELGLWVVDEADLECHGFDHIGGDPPSFTSDNPEWKDQYLDRARQMVARDKNHACVIIWSLGNEAFYGQNHEAMYQLVREMDGTRLVHYEADREGQSADVLSRMYLSLDEVLERAEEKDWTKPFMLCEFAHAMGNGPGNVGEYIEMFYKYPRLMGGWVWEWANHGLRTKSPDGEEYMGYGGDFGDEPNDGNFVMDGLLFSDHTPTPGLLEYAKAIEPVQTLSLDSNKVTIINRYDFIGLEHLNCDWFVVEGTGVYPGGTFEMPSNIKPHQEVILHLGGLPTDLLKTLHEEAHLRLIFSLRQDTSWALAGHQVAFGELQLRKPPSLAQVRSLMPSSSSSSSSILGPITWSLSDSCIAITPTTITGPPTVWKFDIAAGLLVSWTRAGKERLTTPVTMDFYRALTDNDRKGHGAEWIESRLHETRHHVRQVKWHNTDYGLRVDVVARIAPPVLAWAVDVVLAYKFHKDASLTLHVHGKPHGLLLPSTFARIGLTLGLADVAEVTWIGRGPGESYSDKKLSQPFGFHASTVDGLWVDYEYPQDGGNRTDIREVSFLAQEERVLRARFGDLDGASFSAMRYTTRDIDECTHPYELHKRKREDTIVRLDWMHHGLGTGSCGPWTLPEYQLRTDKEFDLEILLD